MDKTKEIETEQKRRIEFGNMARNFLQSREWLELVKPIIDSMIKGLVDIRDIKKSLLSSNKKAEILVEGRAMAADYLSEIQTLIEGYVADADMIMSILEKKEKGQELYKVVE